MSIPYGITAMLHPIALVKYGLSPLHGRVPIHVPGTHLDIQLPVPEWLKPAYEAAARAAIAHAGGLLPLRLLGAALTGVGVFALAMSLLVMDRTAKLW